MTRARSRGFGLLLTLFGMGFIVLTLGAGIDFSHIYLVQGELQAEVDELAMRAARTLDGTAEGVERARRIASWDGEAGARDEFLVFATDRVLSSAVQFAREPGGVWTGAPEDAGGYRYVRVRAKAAARLFFLPMIPGGASSQEVPVAATAGQQRVLAPTATSYSVVAVNAFDPDFGFRRNSLRALVAEDGGTCGAGLERRLRQDTDSISKTYEEYSLFGNGQRVITIAVRGSQEDAAPIGYATFLIPPEVVDTGACEAAYAGNAPVRNAGRNGAGDPGLYEVRLIQ